MIKIEEKENLVRKRGKRWDSFHIVKFNKMPFVWQCPDVSDVSATDSVEFPKKKKKNMEWFQIVKDVKIETNCKSCANSQTKISQDFLF